MIMDHSDPNNWLRTGLSDIRLRNIGIIAVVWNSVEFDLQELISAALGFSPDYSLLITADMPNVSRYQLAKNLVNYVVKHEQLRTELLTALEFFDQCRIRRNAVVHGMPVYDEDSKRLSGRMAKIEARQGAGEVRFRHYQLSDKFINALLWDLWICRQALTDAERKLLRLRKFVADPEVQQTTTLEKYVFEYADPPLDTERVRQRLDQLRSVAPNQDTPEHPPESLPASAVTHP